MERLAVKGQDDHLSGFGLDQTFATEASLFVSSKGSEVVHSGIDDNDRVPSALSRSASNLMNTALWPWPIISGSPMNASIAREPAAQVR